jgi:hypothetical protein
MCVCEKPTINGELGYHWNDVNKPAGVYRVNPPELGEGDSLLYDEHYGANLWLVKRVANDLAQSPRNSVRVVEEGK